MLCRMQVGESMDFNSLYDPVATPGLYDELLTWLVEIIEQPRHLHHRIPSACNYTLPTCASKHTLTTFLSL